MLSNTPEKFLNCPIKWILLYIVPCKVLNNFSSGSGTQNFWMGPSSWSCSFTHCKRTDLIQSAAFKHPPHTPNTHTTQEHRLHEYRLHRHYLSLISSGPPFKMGNVRFTTLNIWLVIEARELNVFISKKLGLNVKKLECTLHIHSGQYTLAWTQCSANVIYLFFPVQWI